MSAEGSVRVVVASKRSPVRTVNLVRPIYSPTGVLLGSQSSVAVLYGSTLDTSHVRAIKEARRLSCNLGLKLEVVDRSSSNPLRRLISGLVRRRAPASLILSP
jgi:hypothetical protein